MPPNPVFRKEALERLRSPEQLDRLLAVVRPRQLLLVGTVVAGLVAAAVWSVVVTVPVRVSGRGVLVRPGGVVALEAGTAGVVAEVRHQLGDEVQEGEVLATLLHPELALLDEPARRRVREQIGELRRSLGPAALDVAIGRSEARVAELLATDHPGVRRGLALERVGAAVASERMAKARAEANRRLEDAAAASGEDVDRAREAVAGASGARAELQAETEALPVTESARQRALEDELGRLAALRAERARGDAGEDTVGTVDPLAVATPVPAPSTGTLVDLSLVVGQVLAVGDRFGSLSIWDEREPLSVVALFDDRAAGRLRGGLDVEVSLDAAVRARDGAIRGQLREPSAWPASGEQVRALVGHAGVADDLAADGRRILARVDLLTDADGDWVWTLPRDEHPQARPGGTATVLVTVERRRPIGYLLPFLRGLVDPA